MSKRIEQLDSMRGLAAFAVMISHLPFIAMALPLAAYKLLVMLRVINGHISVMLFFILSGFVL